MAIKLLDDNQQIPWIQVPVSSLTASKDTLVARDTANAVAIAVTNSVGTSTTLLGVLKDAVTSSDTLAKVIPIVANPSQLWEVDCTNTAAADQLLKNQGMTNSSTVANTNTHISTNLGVFVPVRLGSTSTKLVGYFTALHADAV